MNIVEAVLKSAGFAFLLVAFFFTVFAISHGAVFGPLALIVFRVMFLVFFLICLISAINKK